jgi:hypothetical protein
VRTVAAVSGLQGGALVLVLVLDMDTQLDEPSLGHFLADWGTVKSEQMWELELVVLNAV